MKNIQIDKNSGLYKLFQFAESYTLAGLMIEKDGGVINSFNDVCTFIRHFIFGILFLVPLTAIIALIFLMIVLLGLIYLPLCAIFGFGSDTENGAGGFILTVYGLLIIVYISLCTFQHFKNIREDKQREKLYNGDYIKEEPGTIGKIFEIISSKHSKFCKRLEVVDSKENKE